jgi:hypothetical protein
VAPGAQDTRTSEVLWTEGERKTSLLFIDLLWKLVQRYPHARTIHVILDNYAIHKTQQVELALASAEGRRLGLHFLPPYCPDHNAIGCANFDWRPLGVLNRLGRPPLGGGSKKRMEAGE